MFRKVLIANRGEVAVRLIRACRALDLRTVAIYSTADRAALHVELADERVCIGPPRAEHSYLSIPAVVSAALATGAEAVHPGYGFLAENADFADACARCGLTFVGPRARVIRLMGDKAHARRMAARAGVPVLPGLERPLEAEAAAAEGAALGFPLVVKAAAGGGGRGVRIVWRAGQLAGSLAAAAAEAGAAFGDSRVYLERYLPGARHIEVQVLGDRHGHRLALGERDCSLQRRHQKLLEEAPSPGLDPALRRALAAAALRIATALRYTGLGTVEFLVEPAAGSFYFLEMNTRLQVEHPVSEAVSGVDLVKESLRVAAGFPLSVGEDEIEPFGHALEARIYAEDPVTLRPTPGVVGCCRFPSGPGIRVDAGVEAGREVPVHYDPLVAKIIAHGRDRNESLARLTVALDECCIEGLGTNLPLLRRLVREPEIRAGGVTTEYLDEWLGRNARPSGSAAAAGGRRR